MIFATEGAIQAIVEKRKTQTRRLIKNSDFLAVDFYPLKKGEVAVVKSIEDLELTKKRGYKIKWQVGKTYSVQLGRGKPAVWWCSNCKTAVEEMYSTCPCNAPGPNGKLKIRITKIRKEKFLDISEADTRKEGYRIEQGYSTMLPIGRCGCHLITSGRDYFLQEFFKINKKDYCSTKEWNPEVWVLDFEVVK